MSSGLPDSVLADIRAHAQREYPKECCGFVIVERGKPVYLPVANRSELPDQNFAIAPQDWAAAEDRGQIIRVVHSHCNISPDPSDGDRVSCERTQVMWLIVNWPTGQIVEFAPSGFKAPLVGRPFAHGTLDCYALIRDYYRETLGIEIIDFDRREQWWLKGDNLYMQGYEQAGFVRINDLDTIQEHDVLMMQIASPVVNHAAVYVGNNQILQHCAGRLSSRDVYGGGWRRATRFLVRHKSLC